MKTVIAACCAALLAAALPAVAAEDFKPARIKLPYAEQQAAMTTMAKSAAAGARIKYHNGPVMTAPVNTIYVIWYGSFPVTGAANDTKTIMSDFFANIGGSPQYNVNTTYYDASKTFVKNALHWDPATTSYDDNYSVGHSPTDSQIITIVSNAIRGNHLPADDNAIYFVVTSPDATSKLRSGCAWHDGSSTLISGHKIKYSSIPVYGGSQLQGCDGNVQNFKEQNSPNDNLEADNALDSFMHELSEAITDPMPTTGWATRTGSENGDLCNFNYGTTYLAPNGTHADAHIGKRDYLVQTIWQNTGTGLCANTH
ncbi:MAG TPA: hypothetical protein VIP05_27835 [Burkholderiaceae bacterium]